MADKWKDLVHDSLVEIGAKSDGDPLTSDELSGGLRRLGGMLDQWAQEGLLLPVHATITHAATEERDTYRIGATGTLSDGSDPEIVFDRPIEQIRVFNYHREGWENDFPLREAGFKVVQHNHTILHTYPCMWYLERDYPVAKIYFDAPTQIGDSFNFRFQTHLGSSAIASDGEGDISDLFPSGYREAILLNLAVKLAPSYGVKDGRASGLSAQTTRGATRALRAIRKRYIQDNTSILDPALRHRRGSMIQSAGHYY